MVVKILCKAVASWPLRHILFIHYLDLTRSKNIPICFAFGFISNAGSFKKRQTALTQIVSDNWHVSWLKLSSILCLACGCSVPWHCRRVWHADTHTQVVQARLWSPDILTYVGLRALYIFLLWCYVSVTVCYWMYKSLDKTTLQGAGYQSPYPIKNANILQNDNAEINIMWSILWIYFCMACSFFRHLFLPVSPYLCVFLCAKCFSPAYIQCCRSVSR